MLNKKISKVKLSTWNGTVGVSHLVGKYENQFKDIAHRSSHIHIHIV
jgi:hypothetical protein